MRYFFNVFCALVALIFVGCNNTDGQDIYDPFVDTDDDTTDDGVEEIPGYEPEVCDPRDIAVYDPNQVITYEIDADEQTLAMLDEIGYGWYYGETYDQLVYYAESIAIDAPGCQTIVFDQPRVELGRQMGYQSAYAEGSWIVEYNEMNHDQILGDYDDARYWAPIYDGPVVEMFIYNWSMDYIDHMPHRDMAWMRMRTTWWGGQEAIYNSLEPIKDDFAKRNNMVGLWEGVDIWQYPGNGGDCEYGDCNAIGDRVFECAGALGGLSDYDNLIAETGACYDWEEIAAVLAWQDWFFHWDGCGSNNCYQYFTGDSSDPSSWKHGLVITGVDLLLNEVYTSSENTDFIWTGGSFKWACLEDGSESGCRQMYTDYLMALNEVSRSGQMEADLREVYALRESLDIARDGDEDWLEQAINWVAKRPDFVEQGIANMNNQCGYWSDTGFVWCDTGMLDSGQLDSGFTPVDSGVADSGNI
jgi:hypothetical protein